MDLALLIYMGGGDFSPISLISLELEVTGYINNLCACSCPSTHSNLWSVCLSLVWWVSLLFPCPGVSEYEAVFYINMLYMVQMKKATK